jgi:hypothetical protein
MADAETGAAADIEIAARAHAQIGIGSRAYVRTEYRYSNYQDGVDRHQVVGGIGVRF